MFDINWPLLFLRLLATAVILKVNMGPGCWYPKERAYMASMKSDLRNLVTALDSTRAGQASLEAGALTDFVARFPHSDRVTLTVMAGGDAPRIVARHPGAKGWTCRVRLGTDSASSAIPQDMMREPKCYPPMAGDPTT